MIALLVIVALAYASAEDPAQKIVGGVRANYGDHPYICSLQYRSGASWYHICGCIIYSNRKIVTAAHCLSYPASSYRIAVGNHIMSQADAYEVLHDVTSYTNHPQYNGNAPGYPNDIACMRTTTTINTANNFVTPGTFDTGNSWQGQSCFLSGWGRLVGGGATADTLKRATITKISNSECASRWALVSGASINSNHICFYTGSGISACNGDSGGPARCGNTIVGVTSWGISTCSGSYPSVYTRVAGYVNWINNNCN